MIREHKLLHPNFDKIISAIKAGEKWVWIESVYGCTSSTICRYRKKMKLNKPLNKTTPSDRMKMVELRKEMKLADIAQMFGVSKSYVSKICLKAYSAQPHPH